MSGGSSSEAGWFTRLEPAQVPCDWPRRADDPRLGEIIEKWNGDIAALTPGRGVLVGFPQDEGVRRNQGRTGQAQAPNEIRRWLYRLAAGDAGRGIDFRRAPPLDAGNIRIEGSLEHSQEALGEVVAGILKAGAVPVVLGGGHETAFGHFLGYVGVRRKVTVINLDAHLDVRPLADGLGHSGSPFRQILEHPSGLADYVCLGAQPHSVSEAHLDFLQAHEGRVIWRDEVVARLFEVVEKQMLVDPSRDCWISVDADVAHVADVPAVSAPNANGIAGAEVIETARFAGQSSRVTSFELVEINPALDRDAQSSRWAALVVWSFLVGLALRSHLSKT